MNSIHSIKSYYNNINDINDSTIKNILRTFYKKKS